MAFTPTTFIPLSAQANSNAPRMYMYSTSDAIATVATADYFLTRYQNLQAGDIIVVKIGAAEFHELVVLTSASSGVTVQLKTSQELTASGAVNPGVKSLELNHATVIIASTIADAKAHQGLFAIVNTSASGTAAHTVTLTAGTFNGTNTIATLNAPLEALFVWFDSAGNGSIVENVGTVALSGP
jgi:hypothetical protein